jgi:hypothetical protein
MPFFDSLGACLGKRHPFRYLRPLPINRPGAVKAYPRFHTIFPFIAVQPTNKWPRQGMLHFVYSPHRTTLRHHGMENLFQITRVYILFHNNNDGGNASASGPPDYLGYFSGYSIVRNFGGHDDSVTSSLRYNVGAGDWQSLPSEFIQEGGALGYGERCGRVINRDARTDMVNIGSFRWVIAFTRTTGQGLLSSLR